MELIYVMGLLQLDKKKKKHPDWEGRTKTTLFSWVLVAHSCNPSSQEVESRRIKV
jgi:hypothetical protein